MNFKQALKEFNSPVVEEMKNREVMLAFIENNPDVLTRENKVAHLTGSSMIFNESLDKVLMIYHNIYQSWGWTGGHADGQANLMELAIKEAKEETGLTEIKVLSDQIVSLDILPVFPHYKNGEYVTAHLHFSLAYCFMASEAQAVSIKPDENSGVQWILVEDIEKFVNEEHMLPIYDKMINKALKQGFIEKP